MASLMGGSLRNLAVAHYTLAMGSSIMAQNVCAFPGELNPMPRPVYILYIAVLD
jgi:hypothetical protein